MKRKRTPKSSLATAGYQRQETHAGIADLDAGVHVDHQKVKQWLRSWGKSNETKAPRCPRPSPEISA